MKAIDGYSPGGDAQAIKRIADACYGGYLQMFDAHGWPERGTNLMTSAPSRIVEEYGSVRAFEAAHPLGDLMFPMAAIKSHPPNVWLTSMYGFAPEDWGLHPFTKEAHLNTFIKETQPGVLCVVYGAMKAPQDMRRKVIGIQQCTHEVRPSKELMSARYWEEKQSDPETARRWNYAVRIARAWRVTPESRMHIEDFAPDVASTGSWRTIGALGTQLSPREALNILELDLQEVDVYGETPIIGSAVGSAKEILAPSKAGPVSQAPFVTKESEGPKHLYLLKLRGDADAFLGEAADGGLIVKAGFSKSPQTRCDDHNRTLPKCAYRWEVLRSGVESGYEPYPSSDHAKAGERAMQDVFCRFPEGRSLGGEFFLIKPELIDEGWQEGNLTAKGYTK